MSWNFGDLFDATARNVPPDRPALIQGDRVVSWGDFDLRTNRLARAMLEQGLQPGDRVAIMARNIPEFIEIAAAAFKARLTHVNVNYRYTTAEVAHVLRDCSASALFYQEEFADLVTPLFNELSHLVLGKCIGGVSDDYQALVESGDGSPLAIVRSPDDGYLLYTGGTTGKPKGVMWKSNDARRVQLEAPTVTQRIETMDDHCALVRNNPAPGRCIPACPLMHGAGLNSSVAELLAGGSAVLLPSNRFDPVELLDEIDRVKATRVLIVGEVFARPVGRCLDEYPGRWDLSSMRVISSAGLMWGSESKQALLRAMPQLKLIDNLGASEASGFGYAVTTADHITETGCFSPAKNTVIIDRDSGRIIEPGETGRGWLARREPFASGYFGDPQKTADTYRTIDGVKYAIPGDVAEFDHQGMLRLLGRDSMCINTGGEKVFVEEVEEAIKCAPQVRDVMVVGVPDEQWGRRVVALLQVEPDYDEVEVRNAIARELAAYKVPKQFLVMDTLPRHASGKGDYNRAQSVAAQEQVGIMETDESSAEVDKAANKVDVLVVGAGIGGMYAIHKFREMGLSVQGIESGGDVGGVWYWNRYPGARCDLMSIDYSYSFSEEIQQEWTWSEQFAAQGEILAYLNFVADKLDLRRDIHFNTRVTRAEYRPARHTWLVTTDVGDVYEANYCIMATGPLSIPKDPAFPGTESFEGEIYFAGKWPHEGVDFTGKRVGLIGTGSTGIQITPVVAELADSLVVFQRTPSFTLPMRNVELDEEYVDEVKRNYAGLREAARASRIGGMRPVSSRAYFSVPRDQRLQLMEDAWNESGLAFLGTFTDLLVNEEANEQVADFVRAKIEQVVNDPKVAEQLKPRGYPIFARRPCLDTYYYETFNESHVRLVDCIEEPIECLTDRGLKTAKGEYELDILIFATGYDSLSGAMLAFDIIGRDGMPLKEKWGHGPVSYMGLVMKDFPNLFSVCGANSPSALANIFTLNEQNVDWIGDCVSHMRANGLSSVEATEKAEDDWMALVANIASKTLISKANTWYVGANIKGKPKGLTMYAGGFLTYRQFCDEVVAAGFPGLSFQRLHADTECMQESK